MQVELYIQPANSTCVDFNLQNRPAGLDQKFNLQIQPAQVENKIQPAQIQPARLREYMAAGHM